MEFRVVNEDGSTGVAPPDISDWLKKELVQRQATTKKPAGGISVGFEYRYDDTIDWDADEDNVSPYIPLSNPDQSLARQRHPAEVVIPMPVIRIQFDYPLAQPVIYEYQADTPGGFSRIHLARCVVAGYNRIYKEEDDFVAKQKIEEKPHTGPYMFNRRTTNGPHGIWGHSLGDLVLHTVEQVEDNLFSLGVDS